MPSEFVALFKKEFRGGTVVAGDLRFPIEGAFVTVLFGPSGGGKTTILRCLAGLETPEQGRIHWGEQLWFDAPLRVNLSPQSRQIGFLFQDYALFPHLTVAENVAYRLQPTTSSDRAMKVVGLLEKFGLTGLGSRYPRQISGGEQQRVALARAVACRPRLLLLDEPLSALDSLSRDQLRGELRRWISELGIPVVLVTHDRLEAVALGDRVILIDQGRVRQAGPVEEVFSRPADEVVARIVGVETVIPGKINHRAEGMATVSVGTVELTALAPDDSSQEVLVCIRGEEVSLQQGDSGTTSVRNRLQARVLEMIAEGPLVRVTLDCGFPLTALITRPAAVELQLKPGDQVTACLKAPAIHLLPHSTRMN